MRTREMLTGAWEEPGRKQPRIRRRAGRGRAACTRPGRRVGEELTLTQSEKDGRCLLGSLSPASFLPVLTEATLGGGERMTGGWGSGY